MDKDPAKGESGPAAGFPGPSSAPSGSDSGVQAAKPGNTYQIKRRSPIACRRCRRMRTKCIHERGKAPCESCAALGKIDECVFPVRGQPDSDRDYRHPRKKGEKAKQPSSRTRRGSSTAVPPSIEDVQESFPPLAELVDGVNKFTRNYFQLGFLPKKQFPEKLLANPTSIDVFLVVSILSISARLTPCLARRYGSGVAAADYFIAQAQRLALTRLYNEPTLELCQSFYLLSIAQQGSGMRNKSSINMGIALRMASLMRLHREEEYHLASNAPKEDVIRAESARRTLWMLHSQDSLHCGPKTPVSLSAADITALLPCDEEDFANGRQPLQRAALEGTPTAAENPPLVNLAQRSLFATLMQIHHFWGMVSRGAVTFARSLRPWESNSKFSQMAAKLKQWEDSLPAEHKWSFANLKSHKEKNEDLAYLCVTMMTRLCNIVLRRPYLQDMVQGTNNTVDHHLFYKELSKVLFKDTYELYVQVEAQFTNREPEDSVGAQIASFCVYSCGLFSVYLVKHPWVCPDNDIVRNAPGMVRRTMTILKECKEIWPLAERWVDALAGFMKDPKAGSAHKEGSMDDGKDPIPRALPPIRPAIARSKSDLSMTDRAMADRILPPPGSHPVPSPAASASSPKSVDVPMQHAPSPPQNQEATQHHSQTSQPKNPETNKPMLYSHQPQQQLTAPQTQSQPNFQLPLQQQQFPTLVTPVMPQQPLYMTPQNPSNPATANATGQVYGGFNMLPSPYSTQPQQQQQQLAPHPYAAALQTAPDPSLYPSLQPTNDGFENELQFYIDGTNAQAWNMASGNWLGSGI